MKEFALDLTHNTNATERNVTTQRKYYAPYVLRLDVTSPVDSLYFQDPDGHKLEIQKGTWQSHLKAKKANTEK
jgi:hypothetical protein